jgi:iron-sulfur cluster repair protein YtfE (RIC family)
MLDLKNLKSEDPLKRMVEKESGLAELSPMDPPEAMKPPNVDAVPYEEMHSCLQKFIDEHKQCSEELEKFEKRLIEFKESAWKLTKHTEQQFSLFFSFMDEKMVKHHLKEEKVLFPILQKKLIENKEHSQGRFPKTAIDMLEDDHVKINQHLTLMFNFIALAVRLPDFHSKVITYDVATEQGFAMIELLKLHIFREDNVVFPKAYKYISNKEFDLMLGQLESYDQY